jgi:ribosomal protein S17
MEMRITAETTQIRPQSDTKYIKLTNRGRNVASNEIQDPNENWYNGECVDIEECRSPVNTQRVHVVRERARDVIQ